MSLTQKKTEELVKELAGNREELRGLRFNVAGSKVRNVKRGRKVRQEIARILTELNRRKA